jgi:hypothetical protein
MYMHPRLSPFSRLIEVKFDRIPFLNRLNRPNSTTREPDWVICHFETAAV